MMMGQEYDVLQIVRERLVQLGADGLCDDDECGCLVEDIAPCGKIGHGCVPARNDEERARAHGGDFCMVPMFAPCPKCAGAGNYSALRHAAGDVEGEGTCEYSTFPCALCDGSGRVSPEQAATAARGAGVREARAARELNLREAADACGVSIVEMSAVERCICLDEVAVTCVRGFFFPEEADPAALPREGTQAFLAKEIAREREEDDA